MRCISLILVAGLPPRRVNYGEIATVNRSHVLERFKTCKFHFNDCSGTGRLEQEKKTEEVLKDCAIVV